MWSARLAQAVKGSGGEPTVVARPQEEYGDFDVAIVNLSGKRFDLSTDVPKFKAKGIWVLAHAGHKEKDLLAFGNEIGCDCVVTNGTLAHKLPELLAPRKIAGS